LGTSGSGARIWHDVDIMMHRTQITFDPAEHRRAKRRAAELGISLAEYVRRLVERDLAGPTPQSDPSGLFGLGDSGGSDVAAEKDRYVGEAVAGRPPR
jgi:hypothetical protein